MAKICAPLAVTNACECDAALVESHNKDVAHTHDDTHVNEGAIVRPSPDARVVHHLGTVLGLGQQQARHDVLVVAGLKIITTSAKQTSTQSYSRHIHKRRNSQSPK